MKRISGLGIGVVALSLLGACSSSSGSEPMESAPASSDPATSEPASDPTPQSSDDAETLYALLQNEDGTTIRFDSCTGPIRILLNPGDLPERVAEFTDVDVVAQLSELLTESAAELSELTGFQIEFAGTSDIALVDDLADTQVIVLNFGSAGFPGREDSLFEQKYVYGASADGWTQILSFQHFESSEGFYIHYQEAAKLADGDRSVGIDEAGKRWLKTILGEAFGLRQLMEGDMDAAGVPDDEHGAQIMYTDSHKENDGVYNLAWGEGDKAGLAAVGADNACF